MGHAIGKILNDHVVVYALLGPSGVRADMTAAEAVAALNAAPGTRAVVTASATGP
jgi:hypothetical protein